MSPPHRGIFELAGTDVETHPRPPGCDISGSSFVTFRRDRRPRRSVSEAVRYRRTVRGPVPTIMRVFSVNTVEAGSPGPRGRHQRIRPTQCENVPITARRGQAPALRYWDGKIRRGEPCSPVRQAPSHSPGPIWKPATSRHFTPLPCHPSPYLLKFPHAPMQQTGLSARMNSRRERRDDCVWKKKTGTVL